MEPGLGSDGRAAAGSYIVTQSPLKPIHGLLKLIVQQRQ